MMQQVMLLPWTLPSPGESGSLGANKALVVDGIVATVSSVTSTTADGSYKINTTIPIKLLLVRPLMLQALHKLHLKQDLQMRL